MTSRNGCIKIRASSQAFQGKSPHRTFPEKLYIPIWASICGLDAFRQFARVKFQMGWSLTSAGSFANFSDNTKHYTLMLKSYIFQRVKERIS